MPNKIPWSYYEILHEIYNHPDELRAVTIRMGYANYHYYWCKERYYMAVWSTLKDFIDHPEKWTANYQYEKYPDQQLNLLWYLTKYYHSSAPLQRS